LVLTCTGKHIFSNLQLKTADKRFSSY